MKVAGARPALLVLAICAGLSACGQDVPESPVIGPANNVTPAAPFAIGAEPGPGLHGIMVTWTPVSQAQSYTLYWRTSPGVTPANGTRAPGLTTSFVHQDAIPGQTYYYVVAAVGPAVEGPPSPEVSATAQGAIALHVESPPVGAQVGSSVPLTVAVWNVDPLASFTASIGTATATLSFDSSIGRWTGTLSLIGQGAPGARELKFTAADVLGKTANANLFVRYDQPPVVTVTSPIDHDTVSSNVHISATCTDDGANGCLSLRAYVDGFNNQPLAQGTASIDVTVSRAGSPGEVRIVIEGADAGGQITRVIRTVTVQ